VVDSRCCVYVHSPPAATLSQTIIRLQTGEMPVVLPSPPKRKRKKPARPGDEDDAGAVNLAAQKKRKASGDGAKPRKARVLCRSHQVISVIVW